MPTTRSWPETAYPGQQLVLCITVWLADIIALVGSCEVASFNTSSSFIWWHCYPILVIQLCKQQSKLKDMKRGDLPKKTINPLKHYNLIEHRTRYTSITHNVFAKMPQKPGTNQTDISGPLEPIIEPKSNESDGAAANDYSEGNIKQDWNHSDFEEPLRKIRKEVASRGEKAEDAKTSDDFEMVNKPKALATPNGGKEKFVVVKSAPNGRRAEEKKGWFPWSA